MALENMITGNRLNMNMITARIIIQMVVITIITTANNSLKTCQQTNNNDDNQVHNNRIEIKMNATTIEMNQPEHETHVAL